MHDADRVNFSKMRRSLVIEVSAVTLAILLVTRVLAAFRGIPVLQQNLSSILGYLLIGVPILMLWWRGRPLDFFSWCWRDFLTSLFWAALTSLVIFPLFWLGAHLWMTKMMGSPGFHAAAIPNLSTTILVQLLVVAFPEEFFFRGYFQSAMNRMFAPRFRILGVTLGWGWLVTAVVFAFAHSILIYQWWHFAIFFPALVFGWLRERTGLVIAPTLFHAACNIMMEWIARSYL